MRTLLKVDDLRRLPPAQQGELIAWLRRLDRNHDPRLLQSVSFEWASPLSLDVQVFTRTAVAEPPREDPHLMAEIRLFETDIPVPLWLRAMADPATV